MALYQLILAYDGTDFSGFQRQGKSRTVQGELEKTLLELGWQERSILFAGRTDTGVHASGQVITFSLDWSHSSTSLQSALNARLPADVSVLSASRIMAAFHPRYDASSRVYTYSVYHQPARHPLLDRFAWRVWPELDGNRLNEAAVLFIGRHDFSGFGRPMKPGSSTAREVFESCWTKQQDGWEYLVEANAFLYHMVRRLVYTQVQYAKRLITREDLHSAINGSGKIRIGLAPAQGLTLTKVKYLGNKREMVEDDEN